MASSISIRESIRWLPDEPSEPTSTVVVTSPQRNYVDLRVLRPESVSGPWPTNEENLLAERLDWGIAGVSSSRMRHDEKGREVSHSQWRHWIDSRTTDPDSATDEGDNYPQTDGSILEKGTMVNPATGRETQYEEVWQDHDPLPISRSSSARSIVLQVDQGVQFRGSVVRVGHYCQGLMRRGDEITAERWEWKDGSWKRLIKIGEDILACQNVLDDDNSFNVGESLDVAGLDWKVIEVVEH